VFVLKVEEVSGGEAINIHGGEESVSVSDVRQRQGEINVR
jgi:hypothetical protein